RLPGHVKTGDRKRRQRSPIAEHPSTHEFTDLSHRMPSMHFYFTVSFSTGCCICNLTAHDCETRGVEGGVEYELAEHGVPHRGVPGLLKQFSRGIALRLFGIVWITYTE